MTMRIRQQIVEDRIEAINIELGLNNIDKAFQIFSHSLFIDQSIHMYNVNDDVDGGQDKQIDNITIEEKDGEAVIYITQSKNEESFSSNSIIQIKNGLNWILNKKRAEISTLSNQKFKDKILECRSIIGDIGPSNVDIRVAYITNALSNNVADECKQEIRSILEQYDNDTYSSFSFELIGAIEIVDRINTNEKKNKKIDANIKLKYDANTPSIIKYHSYGLKGIICTVSAKEIARIVNDDPKGFVFDLNVRKYLGHTGHSKSVNKDIRETCSDEEFSYLFWFLNNGITIVCDKADPVTDPDDAHVKISNMQIVNGCQTSSALALAEKEGILESNTHVMLKIFETDNLDLVDRIVLTTNNQNKITNRNLRANDKIQRDFEMAFQIYDYFYERKNDQFIGKDSRKVISNELAATSYLAIALKRPCDARSRKYKIWDEYYDDIFKNLNVETFITCFLIKEIVSSYINNSDYIKNDDDLIRFIARNGQFHIARIVAHLWRGTDNWTKNTEVKRQLKDLQSNPNILYPYISEAFNLISDIFDTNKGMTIDLNKTFKSSTFDNAINIKLYSKTDSSPLKKRQSSGFNDQLAFVFD